MERWWQRRADAWLAGHRRTELRLRQVQHAAHASTELARLDTAQRSRRRANALRDAACRVLGLSCLPPPSPPRGLLEPPPPPTPPQSPRWRIFTQLSVVHQRSCAAKRRATAARALLAVTLNVTCDGCEQNLLLCCRSRVFAFYLSTQCKTHCGRQATQAGLLARPVHKHHVVARWYLDNTTGRYAEEPKGPNNQQHPQPRARAPYIGRCRVLT